MSMNKLLTYEGGQPVTTGDFDFLQECYTEVIRSLMRGVTDGMNCVLHGIEYGEQGIIPGFVSPGAVCIDGDIFLVTEELKSTNGRYLCVRQSEAEAREFKDSQTHNVYLRHEAYLSGVTDGAYRFVDLASVKKLKDIISQEAYWEISSLYTLAPGVTGRIEKRDLHTGREIRIRLNKSASDNNTLFTYGSTRLPYPSSCVAVDENHKKAVVLLSDLGTCSMFNADGTPYNESASFRNVILK